VTNDVTKHKPQYRPGTVLVSEKSHGKGGRGDKVKSRKQAIAIGPSKARKGEESSKEIIIVSPTAVRLVVKVEICQLASRTTKHSSSSSAVQGDRSCARLIKHSFPDEPT
jgi:Family of unknown function (DUF6496)